MTPQKLIDGINWVAFNDTRTGLEYIREVEPLEDIALDTIVNAIHYMESIQAMAVNLGVDRDEVYGT